MSRDQVELLSETKEEKWKKETKFKSRFRKCLQICNTFNPWCKSVNGSYALVWISFSCWLFIRQSISGHWWRSGNQSRCMCCRPSQHSLMSSGTEVFKHCQPLLFSSSNHSCAQVATFLYGTRSLGSGAVPERKAEGTIKAITQPESWKTN